VSAHGSGNRRRRGDHDHAHEGGGDERWLLTYADMITLLMALFIVMWSISSVNESKFEQLKRSLNAAFNGKPIEGSQSVLDGGRQVLESESTPAELVQPRPGERSASSAADAFRQAAALAELEGLRRVKQAIDGYAARHGFANDLETKITERGLVVRLLTDEVLFDTGEAVVKKHSLPLLATIASLLSDGTVTNPVRVEGHTDDVPISTAHYRSNWELSAARASAVLQLLLANGVSPPRLSLAGYGDQRRTASNSTAAGRALNRRVELVVLRRFAPAALQEAQR